MKCQSWPSGAFRNWLINMVLESIADKGELDLNRLAYNKVKDSGIVSFRDITYTLGHTFHLSRNQTFQLLKTWEKRGWVRIYPYHGVRFLKEVEV